MLFNSIEFALFLPIVFLFYWLLKKSRQSQNILLLVASYVFYGWWDWRFLSLIAFSSVVDYSIGRGLLSNNEKKRKLLLWTSIVVNLGILGVFKYYNFFLDSFIDAFKWFGMEFSVSRLNIILPVGISFYTFQTLSYSIDVYRRKMEPSRDIISFFTFVSFFPQLVAGPIERASHLLPQFHKKRIFDYKLASDGTRQILWGLFKKVVIADNCALLVNDIFENYEIFNGVTLVLGAFYFAIQIYCDFSGYSDIAIGTARLFGFDLMQNFAFPYFSRNIGEFWRRWHISLSTWFRDYLYIPLGGSRGTMYKKIRNTVIIFLVSGFWHGANWTFIWWGAINAIYFLPLLIAGNNRNYVDVAAENKFFASFKEFGQILLTFGLVCFAWIFFRAENITHAWDYIFGIGQRAFENPGQPLLFLSKSVNIFIVLLVVIEWFHRSKRHGLQIDKTISSQIVRSVIYLSLALFIVLMATKTDASFIYFQF